MAVVLIGCKKALVSTEWDIFLFCQTELRIHAHLSSRIQEGPILAL